MLQFWQFIFSSFWIWLGTAILFHFIALAGFRVLRAVRG